MLTQANAYRTPLAGESVHLIVCSPPYKSKRDYGLPPQIYGGRADCEHNWGEEIIQRQRGAPVGKNAKIDHASRSGVEIHQGQFCQHCQAWRGSIGLEPTIELYIQHLVEVFRECWRVLRDDGVMFINIGDTYSGSSPRSTEMEPVTWSQNGKVKKAGMMRAGPVPGLKPKNLCLIPQRLIIALQEDGWIVRSEIIWHKPNPMPESAKDRPTVAHETIFMVTKQGKYFWDQKAVREKIGISTRRTAEFRGESTPYKEHKSFDNSNPAGIKTYAPRGEPSLDGRNLRTVWTIPTENYRGAHFATFPKKLCIPPILGGTSAKGCCKACGAQWERTVSTPKIPKEIRRNVGDDGVKVGYGHKEVNSTGSGQKMQNWREANPPLTTGWQPSCSCNAKVVPAIVFDPFAGTGTVGEVAREAGRQFIGLDLSEEYLALAMARAEKRTPQASIEDEELTLFVFAGLKG